MPLGPGTRLGPYQVVSAIGAGGMGEVYRARDTRLGREVAIKVLPESFANDPERLARFEREAQLLASLNHPNIATIHGVEEAGGAGRAGEAGGPVRSLVMELVDGPTLADRIAEGPVPLDEALPIARQIAEALEAAHDRGVIHRDLKPANIKLTPSGQVKVLDFGLAKLTEAGGASGAGGSGGGGPDALSMSPTISLQATSAGVILGTAAYMSPEQARGRQVDRRADIWAFGCVLYEMLTGRKAFDTGETISDAVAAILKNEPDWNALPAETPGNVRTLLRRCLQKDPQKRLPHIGIARFELEEAASAAPAAPVVAAAPASAPRRHFSWPLAFVAVVAMTYIYSALPWLQDDEPSSDAPIVRSTLLPPDNTTFNTDFMQGVGLPALSPDGTRIVFGARRTDGTTPLWVRSLDALTAQPLAGTEGARFPFWSPDSRFIAFFADGKLKKIDASGGPVLTLTDAANGRGGSWNRSEVIIFAPNTTTATPILRVSSAGGASTPIPSAAGSFPSFLPDGEHFLYQGAAADQNLNIRIGALDGGTNIVVGPGSNAQFANGYLLSVREATLMALPFDPVRLSSTGEAAPVAERVQSVLPSGRAAAFSVSETGRLAYREGGVANGYTLTWVDRAGAKGTTIGGADLVVGDIQFSPDRARVAVVLQEAAATTTDIWIYDTARGLRTRFTFDPGMDGAPVWSPDGHSIVFRSNRKGHYDLYRKSVDSVGTEELLYADDMDKLPTSWSPDGQLLLYSGNRGGTEGQDLWMLPLRTDGGTTTLKPSILLQTPFNEGSAQFSPDGRWVLYTSDESRGVEVYASPFTPRRTLGGKRQISVGGVVAGGPYGIPKWRQDRREIFYVNANRQLMATEVAINDDRLDVGATHPLFAMLTELRQAFEVSADGQRFLLLGTTDDGASVPITLVQNWPAGLKR